MQARLLDLAAELGWQLEAWAVFSNHYHFIAHAEANASGLGQLIHRLHGSTAVWANQRDDTPGRQVWHNYWDTHLTFEPSYFARLNYVLQNPVKHGLVKDARLYRWCSAEWFERTAPPVHARKVARFNTDRVQVHDDYDPV